MNCVGSGRRTSDAFTHSQNAVSPPISGAGHAGNPAPHSQHASYKRLAEIEDEAQLFEDEKAKDVSSLKRQIASANKEMDKRREKYGEVEGHASVLSMKYKLGDTVVEFIIDRDCVDELAAKMMGHGSLGHYKVRLTRN